MRFATASAPASRRRLESGGARGFAALLGPRSTLRWRLDSRATGGRGGERSAVVAGIVAARVAGRRVDATAFRPQQKAVNRALCGYFDAARLGDFRTMLRSVAVVASAGEQQVQCAMLFVQRRRGVSRGDLITVLIGEQIRSPGGPLWQFAGGIHVHCRNCRD